MTVGAAPPGRPVPISTQGGHGGPPLQSFANGIHEICEEAIGCALQGRAMREEPQTPNPIEVGKKSKRSAAHPAERISQSDLFGSYRSRHRTIRIDSRA